MNQPISPEVLTAALSQLEMPTDEALLARVSAVNTFVQGVVDHLAPASREYHKLLYRQAPTYQLTEALFNMLKARDDLGVKELGEVIGDLATDEPLALLFNGLMMDLQPDTFDALMPTSAKIRLAKVKKHWVDLPKMKLTVIDTSLCGIDMSGKVTSTPSKVVQRTINDGSRCIFPLK